MSILMGLTEKTRKSIKISHVYLIAPMGNASDSRQPVGTETWLGNPGNGSEWRFVAGRIIKLKWGIFQHAMFEQTGAKLP